MAEMLLAVIRRCPRHGKVLVWDAAGGLWRCPVVGCFYALPGDPPPEEGV